MNRIYEAHLPRQLYGYKRNDVKFLVISDKYIINSKLLEIQNYILPGDLLVFNNSKMVPSSLDAYSDEFQRFARLNIGTSRMGNKFILEVRPRDLGEKIEKGLAFSILGTDLKIILERKHHKFRRFWWGRLSDERVNVNAVLDMLGRYIRYDHIPFDLPEEYFQGIFYKVPGSVELPSASYPFDDEILANLKGKGADIAEITLHCNLGSLEYHEFEKVRLLLPEQFSIPATTISKIARAKRNGKRIIAIGTTVVRALESIGDFKEAYTNGSGSHLNASPIFGTTEIFIDSLHNLTLVDGIVTGMHESEGSHVRMLEAFQKKERIEEAYGMAEELGFQYHEFGDLEMILKQE